MSRVFLLGGGDNEAGYVRTYWRFIEAAGTGRGRRIAIVVPEPPRGDRAELEATWRAPFQLFDPVRKEDCRLLFVSRDDPLTAERLAHTDPTGVLVADGPRDVLHAALCRDKTWAALALERGLPCAGVGAGAALLARGFVAGGWLLPLLHANIEVAPHDCGQGLDHVVLREGLGLAPFALEVEATQRGGLVRLVQLVAEGAWPEGWAIDEGCMVEIDGAGELRVSGANGAWRVTRNGEGRAQVQSLRAGTVLPASRWRTAECA